MQEISGAAVAAEAGKLVVVVDIGLQGALSGQVRGSDGQVVGGWGQRLKRRLNGTASIVGMLHEVRGLADGRLRCAVGCGDESGRSRPVFGPVARTSFPSVGRSLLWCSGRAKVFEEGSHFSLGDRIVLIACALLDHL